MNICRPLYIALSASQFVGVGDASDWELGSGGYRTHKGASEVTAYADVHITDGARVMALTCFYYDDEPDGEMMVRFGSVTTGNDWWWAVDNVEVNVIPEPGAMGLAGLGAAAGAAFVSRRRKKK